VLSEIDVLVQKIDSLVLTV